MSPGGPAPQAEPPRILPVFPLAGALLLPRGRLPLNIFEPRYLAMTRDAMAGHRMIGMVQPLDPAAGADKPDLYRVGCAGRISSFSETQDGRFLITLTGVTRYAILEELAVDTPYRQVGADYAEFARDRRPEPAGGFDRPRLLRALRSYLALRQIEADWSAIEQAPDEPLVTALAMIAPFAPNEKQALLEAGDLAERARVMIALIEMALLNRGESGKAALN